MWIPPHGAKSVKLPLRWGPLWLWGCGQPNQALKMMNDGWIFDAAFASEEVRQQR